MTRTAPVYTVRWTSQISRSPNRSGQSGNTAAGPSSDSIETIASAGHQSADAPTAVVAAVTVALSATWLRGHSPQTTGLASLLGIVCIGLWLPKLDASADVWGAPRDR